jgi:hypothetical protein
MESPDAGTSLMAVTIGGAGGVLGTLAAVAVKPPVSRREAWVRVVVGASNAFVFTGLICQTCGIHPAKYELTLGVGFSLGFIGWAVLGTVSALLASIRQQAESRGVDSLRSLSRLAGEVARSWAGGFFGNRSEKDDRTDK